MLLHTIIRSCPDPIPHHDHIWWDKRSIATKHGKGMFINDRGPFRCIGKTGCEDTSVSLNGGKADVVV